MAYSIINENIFSFTRFLDDGTKYLVALNFGQNVAVCDFSYESATGKIVLTSGNIITEEFAEGKMLSLDKLILQPGDGFVIQINSSLI